MFGTKDYDRQVSFDVFHQDFPSVRVGVSSEMKIPDVSWELKDEETLPWKEKCSEFSVCMKQDADVGIVSFYNGEIKERRELLLSIVVNKEKKNCSTVEILKVRGSHKALLYRPCMGGDDVIVAIGKVTSDLSEGTIMKCLPNWSTPYFTCPLALVGEATCDRCGTMTKKKCSMVSHMNFSSE